MAISLGNFGRALSGAFSAAKEKISSFIEEHKPDLSAASFNPSHRENLGSDLKPTRFDGISNPTKLIKEALKEWEGKTVHKKIIRDQMAYEVAKAGMDVGRMEEIVEVAALRRVLIKGAKPTVSLTLKDNSILRVEAHGKNIRLGFLKNGESPSNAIYREYTKDEWTVVAEALQLAARGNENSLRLLMVDGMSPQELAFAGISPRPNLGTIQPILNF